MEFLLCVVLLAVGLTTQLASGFVYTVCSTNGGPCKLEEFHQFAHKFIDDTSNFLHSAYIAYCKHVCAIAQNIYETWNKLLKDPSKTPWYQNLWTQFITPIAIRLGLQQRKEVYIEEIVCKSSAPGLALFFSLIFCGLVFYLSRKPKRGDNVKSKLDISAYCREIEEDEVRTNSTRSTLVNNYDQRSCCGCKATISDISERTESGL